MIRGVATWSRIWSIEIANACIHIEKYPDTTLPGAGIAIKSDDDSYWGNSFVLAHQSEKSIMPLLMQEHKDDPKMSHILPILAKMYRKKDDAYVDERRTQVFPSNLPLNTTPR